MIDRFFQFFSNETYDFTSFIDVKNSISNFIKDKTSELSVNQTQFLKKILKRISNLQKNINKILEIEHLIEKEPQQLVVDLYSKARELYSKETADLIKLIKSEI